MSSPRWPTSSSSSSSSPSSAAPVAPTTTAPPPATSALPLLPPPPTITTPFQFPTEITAPASSWRTVPEHHLPPMLATPTALQPLPPILDHLRTWPHSHAPTTTQPPQFQLQPTITDQAIVPVAPGATNVAIEQPGTTTTTTTTLALSATAPGLRFGEGALGLRDLKLDLKLNVEAQVDQNGVVTLKVNANAAVFLPQNTGAVPIGAHPGEAATPLAIAAPIAGQHQHHQHPPQQIEHGTGKRRRGSHHNSQLAKRSRRATPTPTPPTTTTPATTTTSSSSTSSSSRSQGVNPFEFLPDEIALHIFSFVDYLDLCRLALVSKSFNSLTEDNQLWRELCLRDFTKFEHQKVMMALNRRGRRRDPSIPKPNLSSFLIFSFDTRPIIRRERPNITFSDMTKELANRWRNLTSAERQQYVNRSAQDKARFERELQEYVRSKTLGVEPEVASASATAPAAEAEGEQEANAQGESKAVVIPCKERYKAKLEERRLHLRQQQEVEAQLQRERERANETLVTYEVFLLRGGVTYG